LARAEVDTAVGKSEPSRDAWCRGLALAAGTYDGERDQNSRAPVKDREPVHKQMLDAASR